ncbi:hypothetical protein AVU32_gp330 [Vibrio phage ValKK3]|uniref:Uncharacterized protein n=2 Tax=Schizotequatrovirus valkk3 TaxID=1914021 RepID=A0A126HH67_9CAUD|nr:hypothetical protein AVU32_gp330 [Vibrio phage ValKK3]AJT61171.1 hypothetical protein [Vibrio phage ValKK3]ALP47229.1 hypothetical protein phiGrn1_0050 [Vibrio phage phi-Grn1]QNJ54783.1 hypothetical protein vBValMR10Z_243 [Vibrio phage vB_ValM_R10Z]
MSIKTFSEYLNEAKHRGSGVDTHDGKIPYVYADSKDAAAFADFVSSIGMKLDSNGELKLSTRDKVRKFFSELDQEATNFMLHGNFDIIEYM